MMRTFNDLRKQNLFTDVILAVSGKGKWCFSSRNKFKALQNFYFHNKIFRFSVFDFICQFFNSKKIQELIQYLRMPIN